MKPSLKKYYSPISLKISWEYLAGRSANYEPFSIEEKPKGCPWGFTLIELMIVLAIIGILAVIALPFMDSYLDRGRVAQARGEIDRIHKAMVLLDMDTGQWPGHQTPGQINTAGNNEIWNLNNCNAGLRCTDGSFPNWKGPYISPIPQDPWGNSYFLDTDYMTGGQNRVALGSFGPNGVGQNVYDSDDVIQILF